MSPTLISALSIFASLLCVASADFLPFENSQEYMNGSYGSYPVQTYLSDPSILGPVANLLVEPQPGLSPTPYVFWSPVGPYIPHSRPTLLDAAGLSVVWQGEPVKGADYYAPSVQSCNGTDYIVAVVAGDYEWHKAGYWELYNNNYELVYNISTKGQLRDADIHEFWLTPTCTAVVTSYQTREFDLSPYGGLPDGYIMDSYFQEIDLATNDLLFEWQASDHINMNDSYWQAHVYSRGDKRSHGFDPYHINSVEKDRLGNYLVSSRHMCAIYYVSGVTGAIIWQLGGLRNDFRDVSGGNALDFCYQHHARWVDTNLTTISFFDNRNAMLHEFTPDTISRGKIVSLDYEARTAKLEHVYLGTHNVHAEREGSMQVLWDSPEPGNAIVGYGQEPGYTEFSRNGTVLFDVAFGPWALNRKSADNYRALKVNWTGAPTQGPKIAAGPTAHYTFNKTKSTFSVFYTDDDGTYLANDTAYFSWNGATEVDSWIVLASNDTADLSIASHFRTMVPKTSFETSVFVGANTKYVQAVAVNGSNTVLAASPVLNMQLGIDTNKISNSTITAFDLDIATQELRALLKNSFTGGGIVASLKDKLDAIRAKTSSGKGRLVGGLIGGFFTAALLAVCVVPIVLRFRRRKGYAQTASMYDDITFCSDDEEMEKGHVRYSISSVHDAEFEEASGYFEECETDNEEVSDLSVVSGGSTLCETQSAASTSTRSGIEK